MRTWAFVSQKGGAGKSTLCTQIACYAEQCGEAVLIIDIDPQGSAITWSKARNTREPLVVAGTHQDVASTVEKAPDFGATLCIIDTPGKIDHMAVAAIRAAKLVICPTQPSLFDVAALKDTVELLDLCEARPRAIGVVNGVPSQGSDDAYAEAAAAIQGLGLKIAKSFVVHRRPFVVAIGRGKGVTEIAKGDKAAKEIIALWEELNSLDPIVPAVETKEKAR